MPSHLSAIVFLAAVLTAPNVCALVDPVGDHEVAVATVDGQGWLPVGASGSYGDMDLVAFELIEDTANELRFVTSLASARTSSPLRDEMDLYITHDIDVAGVPYQIELRENFGPQGSFWVQLNRRYADQSFPLWNDVIPPDGATLSFSVPRALLQSPDGGIPPRGTPITLVSAHAAGLHLRDRNCGAPGEVAACSLTVRDFLPNDGSTQTIHLESVTDQTYGDIQVTNRHPIRFTNGQATTFLYDVLLANHGDDQVLHVQIQDAPTEWIVHVPTAVELPSGRQTSFVVGITIPFAHSHGRLTLANFTLSNPAVTVPVSVGVSWIDPPQPAGHHDTLFFHYGNHGSDGLWLTTLPNASEQMPNFFERSGPSEDGLQYEAYRLDIPLWPGLLIGLDGDPTREGLATLVLKSVVEGDYEFRGSIRYEPNGNEPNPTPRTIMEIGPTSFSVQGGSNEIKAPIRLLPEGDYIPLVAPGALKVDLRIHQPLIGSTTPSIGMTRFQLDVGASSLQLPLLEYHDPVPNQFELGVQLNALGPTEVRRSPNSAAIFTFEAKGFPSGVLHAEALPGWHATTDGETVILGFRVPDNATDGRTIDGLVRVTDGQAQALAIARVIVDSDASGNDHTLFAQHFDSAPDKPTPGTPILVALLLSSLAWRVAKPAVRRPAT